jgi:hypothetical protein
MKKRYLSLASMMMLCFLLLLISGCGSSSNKESGSGGVVSNVGDTPCTQCHSANREALTGETLIAQYQNSSPHKDSPSANAGNGCEACHGAASQHQGKGPIAYVNPYDNSGARCADCHKSGNFATKFASSNHASVTIEEGSNCVRCHTHEGAVLSNIAGVTGDYNVITNKAYQTIPIPAKGWSQFKCQTCHEHGGGLRTVMARYNNPFKADAANGTLMAWDPNGNREHDAFDLCTSCHTMLTNSYPTGVIGTNGRETSSPLYMGSGTPGHAATGKPPTAKAGYHETSWYRQLTSTHFDNPATGLNATDVALSTGNVIEGYVMRMNKENPCFDCHAHEAKAGTRYGQTTTPTIYSNWAQSGHAGGLLKAKYAAAAGKSGAAQVDSVMISGVGAADTTTNYPAVDAAGAAITITRVTSAGDAWGHYQWERTLNAAGASDRGTCQRCHTATGASNYLSSPATYDYKNNDFSHLTGWVKASAGKATTPSPQQEVLYCWGCHSNAGTGALRNPGAVTAEYKFNGVLAQFPDVAASNVCITCHAGLQSGEAITALTNLTNAAFINPHYIASAGLMYVKDGFIDFIDRNTVIGTSTYGKSLISDADGGALTSTHRRLGTTAINGDSHNPAAFTPGNFDKNGPCVTCHVQATGQPKRGSSHLFGIDWSAFNEVCIKCHSEEGGVPLTAANFQHLFIEEQAVPFQDALALGFDLLLKKFNISYNQAVYPYFYDLKLGPTAAVRDWTRGGALSTADAKKLMGACFNLGLLKREPAAYVHARTYARRLLYDTIDFLDNGKIDMSVGATAVAYNPVKYVRGATSAAPTTESYKYLAGYNRTSLAWNALQRP